MKSLTNHQVEAIRNNICKRGVETIDLEYEMVDHIATAVEEKMDEGSSFYDAFKAVMISFGPYGMEKLQKERNKKLIREGWKLAFQYFKTYFRLPKIILTIAIVLGLYSIYTLSSNAVFIFEVLYITSVVVSLGFVVYDSWKMRHKNFSQLLIVGRLYYITSVLPLNFYGIFSNHLVYSMIGSVAFLSIHIIIQLISFEMKRGIMKDLAEQYKMAFA